MIRKLEKWPKKLREKQRQRYHSNDVVGPSKLLEMISKALELNKQNPTLHFNIWIKFLFQLQHSVFPGWKSVFLSMMISWQRHSLLFRFGKCVFHNFETVSSQEQRSAVKSSSEKSSRKIWNRDLSIPQLYSFCCEAYSCYKQIQKQSLFCSKLVLCKTAEEHKFVWLYFFNFIFYTPYN